MTKSTVSNTQLQLLINELKKLSKQENVKIWGRIASDLEKSARKRREVNISKINRYTKENETIIIPGKVLGSGILDHKLTIAAFNFSQGAIEKIKEANAVPISIIDAMKKNPKGEKMRVIG